MSLTERVWQLLPQLCRIPSISATPAEAEIARFIHGELSKLDYFQRSPNLLRLQPLSACPDSSAVVAGLVRGRGNDTVILLNHHDVVDAGDYGLYKELAFDPQALTEALEPKLLPDSIRRDLESGDWLFGRGTMDMKYGVALHMALTENRAGAASELSGNLLFLSVPDEENNSLGMRHAVTMLRQWQEQYKLNFVAAIDSEPHDLEQGAHMVQTGSDGKLLPLICCVGRETHAGAIYQGLNSNLLLAEVIRLLELNPGFCDTARGEHTLPPTVLKCGDRKLGYNVSTPALSYCLYNMFVLAVTPEEILTKLVSLCRQAHANCLEKLARSIKIYNHNSGDNVPIPPWQPRVMTYAELLAYCRQHHGAAFDQAMGAFEPDPDLDDQHQALSRVELALKYYSESSPLIVIAFAPPYYPPVYNRGESNKERRLLAAVAALQEHALSLGITLGHGQFHRGISDMSYCSLSQADQTLTTLAENCPTWESYLLPLEDVARLDAPVLNLGPWGRDFHKAGERLHIPFAREIAPRLLEFAVERLLAP